MTNSASRAWRLTRRRTLRYGTIGDERLRTSGVAFKNRNCRNDRGDHLRRSAAARRQDVWPPPTAQDRQVFQRGC